jgi:hypothetical protein
MNMNTREFSAWCFNEAVRVGTIINMASAHDGETATEALEDLLRECESDRLCELFGEGIRTYLALDDSTYAALEYLANRRIYGFVVEVHRAIRKYAANLKSSQYSWGYMATKLFYAESLDDAFVDRIQAWAGEQDDKERAAAAVKTPSV